MRLCKLCIDVWQKWRVAADRKTREVQQQSAALEAALEVVQYLHDRNHTLVFDC